MDITNVNLRQYLGTTIPMMLCVGFGNHEQAPCFKHLLPHYETILETDIFLESLWKFFKYRPLAMNLLDKCADIYSDHVVLSVCPIDGLHIGVRARLLLEVTTNFFYQELRATMSNENQKHWVRYCRL